MKSIRAFIAIDIGSEIRARLAELQQKLIQADVYIRWVKPRNMHLTLAFLGNVPAEAFQSLENARYENLQGLEPFQLTAHGTGVFGRRSPSVIARSCSTSSSVWFLPSKQHPSPSKTNGSVLASRQVDLNRYPI